MTSEDDHKFSVTSPKPISRVGSYIFLDPPNFGQNHDQIENKIVVETERGGKQ